MTSSYAWADADKQGDVERIEKVLKEKNIVPAMVVVTGRTPHVRVHVYVKLDGKVTAEEVEDANAALKTLFGSDAVQNPDRLMRLAGTVNYPTKDKLERGYVAELVTLHVREDAPSLHRRAADQPRGQAVRYVWFRQQIRPSPTPS